jgi:hypothetical protein
MGGNPRTSRILPLAALIGASGCFGVCSNTFRFEPSLSREGDVIRACHGVHFVVPQRTQLICSTFDGSGWVSELVDERPLDEYSVYSVRGETYYARLSGGAGEDTLVHATRDDAGRWATTPIGSAGMGLYWLVGDVAPDGTRDILFTADDRNFSPQLSHARRAADRWEPVTRAADELPGSEFQLGGLHAVVSGTLVLVYSDPALGLVVAEQRGGTWIARIHGFLPQPAHAETAHHGGRTFVAIVGPEGTLRLGHLVEGVYEELHRQTPFDGSEIVRFDLAASDSALHVLLTADGASVLVDFDHEGNELARRVVHRSAVRITRQALVATGTGDDLVLAFGTDDDFATVIAHHRVGGAWTERVIISSGDR